jgi:recombination protein RecR
MDKYLPTPLKEAIAEFEKLPGIGPKTAARLVFYLLSKPKESALKFGEAIINMREKLKFCSRCGHISEDQLCLICSDPNRNQKLLAVVEESLDIIAIEKTGKFEGVYHVLGGLLNPLEGITPEMLRIGSLLKRAREENFSEIIIALDPSLEGEATALYIAERLKAIVQETKITRIARGLPVGGDVEYADEMTLLKALENRQKIL